jgi:formate-dependent nitrite reductase membrane component NrfD
MSARRTGEEGVDGRGSGSRAARAAEPSAESYYGQPVIKEPVWTWEIPCYFFTGGLAGASAGLAYAARLRGEEQLERRAWALALTGVSISPLLLISDLGKPARFMNMLRMFKVTSPMSVGSWVLAASGATITLSAGQSLIGVLPRLARPARPLSALLGLPLATYTAALVANTAVPVWHGARRELPFLFAAGSAASAGGLATALTPLEQAGAARRLALAGAVSELATTTVMEHTLGELGETYKDGRAGRFARAAKALTAVGGIVLAAGSRRSRGAAVAGGMMLAAGALSERWSVFCAGQQSAGDPHQTVGPQRERVRRGEGQGASRSEPRRAATVGGAAADGASGSPAGPPASGR